MNGRITAELIPDSEQGGFTARVPDIPAYGEGETEEAAIEDLKVVLRAYVEQFGLEDALSRLNPPSTLRQLDWNLEQLRTRVEISCRVFPPKSEARNPKSETNSKHECKKTTNQQSF